MKKPENCSRISLPLILLVTYLIVPESGAVTLDEIKLMLRSGFSSETIIKEDLMGGRVYGRFDSEREREFRALGASPTLIGALKSGKYAATQEETAEFLQRQHAVQQETANRVREENRQRRDAQRAAQSYAEAQQRVAAQAEANLTQRVINVLSTPLTEYGTPSADQQRVIARAKAVAMERIPVEMSTTVRGDRVDAKAGERRELYQQLISDETFVRETLR